MKLLYLDSCSWEFDFIVNDILINIEKEIEIFNKSDFKLFLNRPEIIENNILVINLVLNFDDIIEVVKYIRPIIIFYLSDECGNLPYMTLLEKYTKILFRQYNHKNYNYSENNYQIPLGYSKYYLDNTNRLSKYYLDNTNRLSIKYKQINERDINCSFIGAEKSDRTIMSNIFKSNIEKTKIIFINNNWDINNLPYSPKECFDTYSNSIFVIIGRGNVSLDCFRIYEAIVAGAIPVVVGDINEIEITFNYNNNIPPFIYEDSWENAAIKCNNLLKDFNKLQLMQNDLMLWWNNTISFIRNLIIKNDSLEYLK